MNKIKAISLAFLLAIFGSSHSLAEYTIGLTGSFAMIDASGQETEGGETTKGEVTHNTGIGSIFVEYNGIMGSNFSLGLDYIPVDADVSDKTKTRTDVETSVTGTATATTTSRTQSAQAEISDHMTLYATYSLDSGAYFKLGYIHADLNTLEPLGTGSTYSNETLDGIEIGAGVEFDMGYADLLGRFEVSYLDYDDISIRSGVARTGVSPNNLIDADLDVTRVSASIAKKF